MGHARRSWRDACDSALREPDPKKLLAVLNTQLRRSKGGMRNGTAILAHRLN